MARAHEHNQQNKLRNHKQRGSAKRDLPSETHCKLRSSAAVGTDNHPTTTVPRSGTDISTMILRTVHRSRFAEPKECVSIFAYPQRRSFGACSGFQIETCPIGTRRRSYCHTVTEVVSLRSTTKELQAAEQTEEAMASRRSHAPTNSQALAESSHANIVQRVKSCYKIKINYRESKSCFYGVLLCKQHPRHTIEPLLHSDSATIRQ